MPKERMIHNGKEFEVVTFDTVVHATAPIKTQLRQIELMLQEEEDTKSGKRKIKPVDRRRKPIIIE